MSAEIAYCQFTPTRALSVHPAATPVQGSKELAQTMVWGGAAVRRLACQMGAFLAIAVLPAMAQDAASQVRAEIERLERSLKERPLAAPGMPNANSDAGHDLKAAFDALSAGRLYAGLETLDRAEGSCRASVP